MTRTRAVLNAAAPGPDDRLEIDITDLWFDIDANGAKGEGEALLSALVQSLFPPWNQPRIAADADRRVHFDAADREWLIAYTHLLSGTSHLVLAFDPTATIAEVMSASAAMAEIKGPLPSSRFYFLDELDVGVDMIATVYGALNRVPEAGHIRTARDHLLDMIAHNRAFWTLADDPPMVDLVTWTQGSGLLPYMEKGPLVSGENMRRFEALFRGEALLFVMLLN